MSRTMIGTHLLLKKAVGGAAVEALIHLLREAGTVVGRSDEHRIWQLQLHGLLQRQPSRVRRDGAICRASHGTAAREE
jgi:hypothetical protein